jgi:hypothetical protein
MQAPDNHRPTRQQIKEALDAIFGPPMETRTGVALFFLALTVGCLVGIALVLVAPYSDLRPVWILLLILGAICFVRFPIDIFIAMSNEAKERKAEAEVKVEAAKPSKPSKPEPEAILPLLPGQPTPPPAPTPEELRAREIARLKRQVADYDAYIKGAPQSAANRLRAERGALQARLDALTAESA